MSNYDYKKPDFDHPSFLFKFEDKLKVALGGRFLYNLYYEHFNLKGSEKVLDFGCGGGVGSRCILKLLNKDGRVTCVDTSKYWIEKAKSRLAKYPNADCKLGDIRELDIPDKSFDIISIIHVIHDIEPVERKDIVKALARKLKKTGKLHIREPIRESHGMPVSEIRTLLYKAGLKEVGFEIRKSEYIGKFQK
jgi:ubiquinone/menaquinone biosynthesis C-methylase UbiE